ncbi:hypothetical protein B0H10DRAFT_487352 [Mycena sp. CBHHK59/15]|nr:hypothetical protein B0H10DRAFT_487352 [Mycena sp. CBHHK59/15]
MFRTTRCAVLSGRNRTLFQLFCEFSATAQSLDRRDHGSTSYWDFITHSKAKFFVLAPLVSFNPRGSRGGLFVVSTAILSDSTDHRGPSSCRRFACSQFAGLSHVAPCAAFTYATPTPRNCQPTISTFPGTAPPSSTRD